MRDNPFELDRRIRDAARALRGFRAELREGRGDDHVFELRGRVASRELMDELAGAGSDPLAPALLRWLARIREAHGLLELEREHARAFRSVLHPLDAPERGEFTLAALLAHALADTKGRRAAFFAVLFERAGKATDLALRLADRRNERRASLGALVAPDFDLPGTAVLSAAEQWLARTDDAFDGVRSESFASLVELGLGRDSRASWPGRVSPRAIAELFREARWLEHAAPAPDATLPALGAASFLRGLFGFGAALRTALVDGKGPFVLAHDTYGLDRATLGALFALLPAQEAFARRALGVSASGAADHRRSLARVLLVATRQAALRVLLRAPSLAGTREFERGYVELGLRALGVELPRTALGVVLTPRPGDAQRFAGVLLAAARSAELTAEHDDDWYRNPRAVEELRETARLPAVTTADAATLELGAEQLASSLRAAT